MENLNLIEDGAFFYHKQHKLILHQVLRANMLLIAVQVFLSYSSRNLTVTLCNCSLSRFVFEWKDATPSELCGW